MARRLIDACKSVSSDPFTLVGSLTAVLLLFHAPGFWYLRGPLVVLCIAGLIHQPLLRKYEYWVLVTALMTATNVFHWHSLDNHKFLTTYWCLSLCLCTLVPEPQRLDALAINARLLIGLCMLFATIWKLLSPTYLDGTFFTFALLSDSRFELVARYACGIPQELLRDNRFREAALTSGHLRDLNIDTVVFHTSPRLAWVAAIITYWTIFIEGTLALAFLLWRSKSSVVLGNLLLMLFVATTYLVAPVRGFGWLLIIMGIAGVAPTEQKPFWTMGYLLLFALILVYTLPVLDVLDALAIQLAGT